MSNRVQLRRYDTPPTNADRIRAMSDEAHLKKELGDLLWFMAEYCTAMGWDFSEIARINIQKLIDRYPDGFEEERSIYRKEGDI